jgi:hypothetical protein
MLDEQTLTLTELLDQAAAAEALGDRDEAERLYRRATERSPGNVRAWLGLAGSVDSLEEKRDYFEKALALNPSNGEARLALERLAAKADADQAAAIQSTLQAAERSAAADGSVVTTQEATAELAAHDHVPIASDEVLYCVNHPDTETSLRCNRCGKPVCVRCVELTEVGYRCKECIREQQNAFFTAVSTDYLVVALVSFLMAAVAAPIIGLLFGIFGLFFGVIIAVFLGPAVGGVAATIIRRSVGRRRGRYLGVVAVVAIILGMLVGILVAAPFGVRVNLIPLGVFLFLALSTIYATLR